MNELEFSLRVSGHLSALAALLALPGCGQVGAPSERPSTPVPSSTS